PPATGRARARDRLHHTGEEAPIGLSDQAAQTQPRSSRASRSAGIMEVLSLAARELSGAFATNFIMKSSGFSRCISRAASEGLGTPAWIRSSVEATPLESGGRGRLHLACKPCPDPSTSILSTPGRV